ncbi:hypothetical protein [Anabaena sp. AL09]|uniref:hypothetical protein n=1 Tax=Anabaena sp. AL09 TaxID=1710891 RepID=UPI0007FDA996|nr:hypothetical protein [Anabaena sp. AL09]OBQ05001.1 MAG: hypothetical protein AN490_14450 [Anabaena sp. AL09]
MLLDDFWWGVGDFYLSESGFPGFEDLWLTPRFAIRMLLDDFWWGWLTPRFAIRMLLDDFWWGVGDFSGCF